MTDHSGIAERDVELQIQTAGAVADVMGRQLRSLSPEQAAITPNKNPRLIPITEAAAAVIPDGVDTARPAFLYGLQALLVEMGLSSDQEALGFKVGEILHDAGYAARHQHTPVRGHVRVVAGSWGSPPHQRLRSTTCAGVDRPRVAHRAGRSKIHGAARRASARSGDSGSDTDDPDDDPEGSPPPSDGRRFCVGCGADISHKRSDATVCGAKCRQRKHRRPDQPDSVIDSDPYLSPRSWEVEVLRQLAVTGCRCNGHHLLGDDGDCIKCGRPYRDGIAPYYERLWMRMHRLSSPVQAVPCAQVHSVSAQRPWRVSKERS